MILRRILPRPRDSGVGSADEWATDIRASDARQRIADLYRPPQGNWVRLNLISTLDGSAAGPDGTSETISNPVDRTILNAIRSSADVVLVGAASARVEGYFVPKRAALAVVTGSGNLAEHRVTSSGERGPFIVLCPTASVARVRETTADAKVQIIAVPDTDGSLAPGDIVAALRNAGLTSIVCEGGPSLAAHLVGGGVVDELCLTTSPQFSGRPPALLGAIGSTPIPVALDQLLIDDEGATYARWRIGRTENVHRLREVG